MKKSRRAVTESSPSSSSAAAGLISVPVREEGRAGGFSPIPVAVCEDARALYKHQVLLQDYEELLKETQAKEKKLQMMAQKKFQLMAEVKFLRQKFRSFAKKPTQEIPYRLKKQCHIMPSPSVQLVQPQIPVNRIEFPSKDAQQGLKESAVPRTCGLLDLNQISFPAAEEMREFPMEWGASKADKLNRFPVEGDAMANDFMHSVVRDVGNSSSNVGKRKISWQDQVTLRA